MLERNLELEKQAINEARGLAIDEVEKANSGHPGIALGAMPAIFELWARHMRFNPKDPKWPNRDRYILSAGHGSAMLYAMSYIFGYAYSLDDLKEFRQLGSKTPGHPDYCLERGVEMTTGPLGQGLATAVGFALGEKHLEAMFNTAEDTIFDYYTYVMAGDGCLMEGITAEASSLAGHLGLDHLIVLYDSNSITIDGSTDVSFTENIRARYEAYGWHTELVDDGNDPEKIGQAIEQAKAVKGKPSLIEIRSNIGFGSPVVNSSASHGSPLGAEGVRQTKEALGLDPDQNFYVSEEVLQYCHDLKKDCQIENQDWQDKVEVYLARGDEKSEALRQYMTGEWPDLMEITDIEEFPEKIATRAASGLILNKWSAIDPFLIGGSADLAASNNTTLKDSSFISRDDYSGKNIHYGIREFAMGAIANGLTLTGFHSFNATFLVFTEYMMYDLREAALMEIPTIFVMTHDSIGLGEDGETHQPVEHLSMFRTMPNLWVWRPADGKETVAAYQSAKRPGPTLLALTRQKLLTCQESSAAKALHGAYIFAENNVSANKPDLILIATGSELQLAKASYQELITENPDLSIRLVSMPCMEAFAAESKEYQEEVLPEACEKRVSVEAGSSMSWYKYVGPKGRIIGLDRFGASGPGDELFKFFGFTTENIVSTCKEILAQ